MSEKGVLKLGDVIREFKDLCKMAYDIVSVKGSYSPRMLIERFDSWIVSTKEYDEMRPEAKETYKRCRDVSLALIETYEIMLYLVLETFTALENVEEKIGIKNAEKIVKLLAEPLRGITVKIVNEWLVKYARIIGKLREECFDDYNVFKEKWNKLLSELEARAERLGMTVKIDVRAKELGVPVVK